MNSPSRWVRASVLPRGLWPCGFRRTSPSPAVGAYGQAARDKGRQVSATRLARAAWTLGVTHVPGERLTVREGLVRGRMRWQIALLFKLWKSHGRVDESRRTTPWRILGEV